MMDNNLLRISPTRLVRADSCMLQAALSELERLGLRDKTQERSSPRSMTRRYRGILFECLLTGKDFPDDAGFLIWQHKLEKSAISEVNAIANYVRTAYNTDSYSLGQRQKVDLLDLITIEYEVDLESPDEVLDIKFTQDILKIWAVESDENTRYKLMQVIVYILVESYKDASDSGKQALKDAYTDFIAGRDYKKSLEKFVASTKIKEGAYIVVQDSFIKDSDPLVRKIKVEVRNQDILPLIYKIHSVSHRIASLAAEVLINGDVPDVYANPIRCGSIGGYDGVRVQCPVLHTCPQGRKLVTGHYSNLLFNVKDIL